MKTTIRECLSHQVFHNAKVAAGEDRLDNIIKKISILEDSDPNKALSYCGDKEQVVVTSFAACRNSVSTQKEIVEVLGTINTSAIILLNVGEILEKVSPIITKAAENAGIVLVEVPYEKGINISIVAEELYKTIYYGNGEKFKNNLINNTIFHLLNFEKYPDFQSAIRGAALSNDFQMVLLSSDFNPIFTVETEYRTTIDRAINLGRNRDVDNPNSVYTMIDVDGVLTYWGPITIEDESYSVFIVDNKDSYTATEITKLAEIIEIAIGMWKFTPLRDAKVEFLKSLRRGKASMADLAKYEAGYIGDKIASVFLITNIEQWDILDTISKYADDGEAKVVYISEGDQVFGAILGKTNNLKILEFYNLLKSKRQGKIFHITGLETIDDACDGFKLINENWRFAKAVYPYKRLFSKFELLLISSCINIYLQGGYQKKYFTNMLNPIEKESKQKRKQLLDTLESFVLDAGMNSTNTANIMNIHVNTVQYRMKRISELIGAEITGERTVPSITIALILKRLEANSLV